MSTGGEGLAERLEWRADNYDKHGDFSNGTHHDDNLTRKELREAAAEIRRLRIERDTEVEKYRIALAELEQRDAALREAEHGLRMAREEAQDGGIREDLRLERIVETCSSALRAITAPEATGGERPFGGARGWRRLAAPRAAPGDST